DVLANPYRGPGGRDHGGHPRRSERVALGGAAGGGNAAAATGPGGVGQQAALGRHRSVAPPSRSTSSLPSSPSCPSCPCPSCRTPSSRPSWPCPSCRTFLPSGRGPESGRTSAGPQDRFRERTPHRRRGQRASSRGVTSFQPEAEAGEKCLLQRPLRKGAPPRGVKKYRVLPACRNSR